MTLGRHARGYLIIGIVQWLVDWGVLVLLSGWGMDVKAANVLGRVAGACLGYWLNGKLTFRGGVEWFGLKENGVRYVYDEQNRQLIPDSVRARVEQLKAEIIAGRIQVPSER